MQVLSSRTRTAHPSRQGSAMRFATSQAARSLTGVKASSISADEARVVLLKAEPLTSEAFHPYGQVVGVQEDGKLFDDEDAQLLGFDQGTPRFYIMRLPRRGTRFNRITFHKKVTQCLGLLAPMKHWYIAVAAPSGSVEAYPKTEDIRVFRIPHGCFIRMKQSTWHAGPLFDGADHMDFYNLELSDTNVTDHNTHDYRKHSNLIYEVVDDQA